MKQISYFFFLVLLVFIPILASGQTNTDFWFAAPEVTSGHGDQPIYLRLTSFNQAANVTISEPANTVTLFPLINVNILANSTVTVDLSAKKEQVESKPPNQALKFGLLIHSNVPITAYYEVAHQNNPEIFTLKGNNALGKSFYIPSQSVLYNEPNLTPKAYNSFDIVATEDNTTVYITPKKAIVGHAAGVQFSVTLNKGEVYSAQATGQLGSDHLMGSKVTSDKPVAITVKDDSDRFSVGQGCYDLTGDQIVPVNIIGSQYIIVRGYTNTTVNDWVFITAITNNTTISVEGTPVITIDAGDSYSFNMISTNLCTSVQTDHPVYLWHLTGYGCETGSALLPAMNCTGSTQVAFTRTSIYSFEMIILTKSGAEGSFTVDGNTGIINASMFSAVPGVTGYMYARVDLPSGTLGTGAHILANTQDIFHMGLIQTYDGGQAGCAYGYFTDFASLNLGPDVSVCPGNTATFDAGSNRQSYAWYYNGNPYVTGVPTITVSNPGLYSVTVNDHGCVLSDTVELSNYTAPNPVISGITSFCEGGSSQLSVQGNFRSYLWTTGAATQSITVITSGTYGVTVIDNNGCQGNTSVVVTVHPLPTVTLAQPASACINTAPYPLSGGSPSGGVYSGPGVNSATGYFDPASGLGSHLITYTYSDSYNCSNSASKTLTVNPLPVVTLTPFPSVCISEPPFPLTGGSPSGGSYTGPGINIFSGLFDPSSGAGPHLITYTYTDGNGCTNSASQTLMVNPLPVVQLAAQTPVCISVPSFLLTGGMPAGGTYSGPGVNSTTGYFDPSSGAGPHQITYTYTNSNGCTNSAMNTLVVYSLPIVQLATQPTVCITSSPFPLTGGTPPGGAYSGIGVNPLTGYFDPSSGIGDHTIIYSYTDLNSCSNSDSKILIVYSLPAVQLAPMADACISSPPFLLTSGTPPGGTYSGPGVNSSTGFFDPSSGAGSHQITYNYTDANGCSNSTSGPLNVNPLPVVQISIQSAVCVSTSPFLLTGGSPAGGIYSGPGVNSSTGIFDPSTGTGSHLITYTYTDANGCTNSNSTPLLVNSLPVVQLASQSSVCISASPFPLTGGTPAGGTYSGPGVNSSTGFFDPSSGSGLHTIIYSYTDANGCLNTASNVLNVDPLPLVQLSPQAEVCISAPPFPLNGGNPAGGTYSGTGVNSSTGSFDPSSGAGAHTITYTFTDGNGCTNFNSKILMVNPLPLVQLAAFSPVCITLQPFLLTGGTPAGGTYSGNGVNSSTGIFNPASGSGNHVITYLYTDANSCTNTAVSGIQVIPLPLPSGTLSGPDPVCEAAQNVQYMLTGADPLASSFNWELNPSAAGSVAGTSSSPTITLNSGFSGILSIRFQPVSNCGNGNFSVYSNVTVNPKPDVWLQSCNDAITTKAAKPFQLKGGIPPGGTYAIDGTDLPSGKLNPAVLTVSPPDHIISYTYTNHFSCSTTKTQSIKVNNASNFICKNTLTDVRDLKTYPTFEIVTGAIHRCWMSANLNYGSFIQDNLAQTDNCSIEKYCQGNDATKCSSSGGLYQWGELMNYLPADNASAQGKQGLCPPEWHVPTEADWAELENFYSGEGLAGWSLTDLNPAFGFHAKTLGILYQNAFWAFIPPGFSATMFWTSTVSPTSSSRIFSHGINEINASVSKYFSTPGNALPVRCVKD